MTNSTSCLTEREAFDYLDHLTRSCVDACLQEEQHPIAQTQLHLSDSLQAMVPIRNNGISAHQGRCIKALTFPTRTQSRNRSTLPPMFLPLHECLNGPEATVLLRLPGRKEYKEAHDEIWTKIRKNAKPPRFKDKDTNSFVRHLVRQRAWDFARLRV